MSRNCIPQIPFCFPLFNFFCQQSFWYQPKSLKVRSVVINKPCTKHDDELMITISRPILCRISSLIFKNQKWVYNICIDDFLSSYQFSAKMTQQAHPKETHLTTHRIKTSVFAAPAEIVCSSAPFQKSSIVTYAESIHARI